MASVRPRGRTELALIEDERLTPLAATVALMDVAKRIAVGAMPTEVPFANIDLTAHVFRAPVGG